MKFQPPRISPAGVLLGCIVVLMSASVFYTRESLLFCERSLYEQFNSLTEKGKPERPIAFTEVCPEMRQRAETMLNKWVEVILALLVQVHPPSPPSP